MPALFPLQEQWMRELSGGARAYIVAVVALACAALVLGLPTIEHPVGVAVLATLTLVLDRTGNGMVRHGNSTIVTTLTLPMATAAYILDGPAAAAVVGTTAFVVSGSRTVWFKRVYNAAQGTLSAFAAGVAYLAVGGPDTVGPGVFPEIVLAVIVGNVVFCVVNASMLAGVMGLSGAAPPMTVLRGTLLQSGVAYVAYGLLGLLVAVLWVGMGIGAPSVVLVLLPLLVARWAMAQYAHEATAYEATIRTLVQAVETKDRYTRGHSERVASASVMIARVIGMRDERITALRYAGILHDVGKLGVPTKLLTKSGPLTDAEFSAIQMHPLRGQQMVADIEFLGEATQGILHHHERIDGQGYPMGLLGDAIPEFARVIAVADAFDSMTSTRSYRGARTVAEAVRELERCRGSQFDPVMVDALVTALRREAWELAPPTELTENLVDYRDHDDPTVEVTVSAS